MNNNYITSKGIECLNSCIYNNLHNKGFNINHSNMFFDGGGFNIHYSGNYGKHMIYSKQYESNFVFIEKYLGKSIHGVLEDYSYQEKCKMLRDMILQNMDVIIRVSSSRLPYNEIFNSKSEVSHYVNVIGFNSKKDTFLVSDGCAPLKKKGVFCGEVAAEDLISNWCNMGSEYLIIVCDNELPYLTDTANTKLKIQLEKYLKGDFGLLRKKYSGYRSIITLLKDMKPLFVNNVPELRNIIMECNKQIQIDGYRQSKDFLIDKMKNMNMDVTAYEKVISEWDKELIMLMKAGISRDADLYESVVSNIDDIIRRENAIIEDILRRLN